MPSFQDIRDYVRRTDVDVSVRAGFLLNVGLQDSDFLLLAEEIDTEAQQIGRCDEGWYADFAKAVRNRKRKHGVNP